MKRIAIAAMFAALLAGCVKGKAERTERAGQDFEVDTLFTKDGCTVYRFMDGGSPRYFTNCKGSTSWRETCGKNCTREQGVGGDSSSQ